MGLAYRMRGLIATTIRTILVLELVHRILRKDISGKRFEKLLACVEEKEEELKELRQQVQAIRPQIDLQEVDDHIQTPAKIAKRPKTACSHEVP